jgi:hypothetical protein
VTHRIAIVASNGGGDEEAKVSSEECIVAAKHNFKCQTRPPKDRLEKLLEVTCQHHSYPVKHKLKDYTMMKNFMTLGTFSKGRMLGGELGVEGVQHPFLGKWRSIQSLTDPTSDPGTLRD